MRTSPQPPPDRSPLRLTVEYDGTAFYGFQWQPDVRTVAGVLEAALSSLLGEPVKIAGAGRTDAGVHATGQVVSFATERPFRWDRFLVAINSLLPEDLRVREASFAGPGFSARFSALERTYVYALFERATPSALLARYAYHVRRALDLDAMRGAATHLLGEHDFRSFCVTPPEGPAGPGPTVRTLRRIAIERRGDLLRVEVAADGFLHRMVRTIVGTLVECGDGRRRPGELPGILAARARETAGHGAPAHGLYLAGVQFDDGYDSYAEPPLFSGAGAAAAAAWPR